MGGGEEEAYVKDRWRPNESAVLSVVFEAGGIYLMVGLKKEFFSRSCRFYGYFDVLISCLPSLQKE